MPKIAGKSVLLYLMKDTYHTISTYSESIFRDKGSKFIGMVFPVDEVESVKPILEELRRQYHDARHHCYAYRIGPEGEEWRQNDDGEPSGSAGKPIYGQFLSMDVTNLLGVVVRYFGGTKLGIPGLINAYRTAIREALDNNTIIEKIITHKLNLRVDYQNLNHVMRIVKQEQIEVASMDSGLDCQIELNVRSSDLERVKDILDSIRHISVKDPGRPEI